VGGELVLASSCNAIQFLIFFRRSALELNELGKNTSFRRMDGRFAKEKYMYYGRRLRVVREDIAVHPSIYEKE
jgi:hypothetical protein